MGSRRLRKEVFSLLANESWDDISDQIKSYRNKDISHHLFSALCSIEPVVKQNAINSFGLVVSNMAEENMEEARKIMRRFLWSLNDESGGIGWGAPEAMGEIMAVNRNLFQEYVHMLISYMREDGPELLQDGNYLELPALQRGLLWGVARLTQERPEEMSELGVERDLVAYLESEDDIVKGIAAHSLGMFKNKKLISYLQKLEDNTTAFIFYWNHKFIKTTVRDRAKQSITQLEQA